MSITRGRDLEHGFEEVADVVIVGSGSGGAVSAAILAEAGLDVVVLEEGGHYTPEEYGSFRPSQSLRRLGREAGLLAVAGIGDTPLISLLQGRCIGGSSVMTGGVCFRIPNDVLHEWSDGLGLAAYAPDEMDRHFTEVEERIHVQEVPVHMRSRSTELFVEGAEKMGIKMKPLRRNTEGCQGRSRCNFGCPVGAKMSVDKSYLPAVSEKAGRIYADTIVERILVENGRAVGVEGRVIGGEEGKPNHKFTVRAKIVIVACGTVHSPMLLETAGVGHASGALGKNITLHPSFRVSALFDENVRGWDGALQSVYSDHFMDDGITLVGVYSPPNVLAAAFPGVGQEHVDLARRMKSFAIFGGMIHDDGGGAVTKNLGREPLLTYRMAERDKRRLVRGFVLVGEMAFAAGAKEVMLPIFGSTPFRRVEDLREVAEYPPHGRSIESIAFHPLGSARMGVNERLGVVKESGECWEVDNLYVADGSVLPTSIGVNSQVPVMAVATKIARGLLERL